MLNSKEIKTAIIGASGYTGAELVRLAYGHPKINIISLVADSNAGKNMGEIYSHLNNFDLPKLVKLDEVDFDKLDLVFCCLPHATSQEIIKDLPSHLKIIDLSADFRLNDPDIYEKWYDTKHKATDLQDEAVYGLSEIFTEEIQNSRLIACPGCYPTSALLPLIPLISNQQIKSTGIIIDSKSGVSGAGRSLKQANLFCEINDGVKAYGVCSHRHIPEIEQALSLFSQGDNKGVEVNFTPQLVPMNRGIISTIYVDLKKDLKAKDLRNILKEKYKDSKFVHILDKDQYPSTRDVYATNQCHIAVCKARSEGKAVIISVIDNLVKGASGQAIQNMNIAYGFEEELGLDAISVFP